MSNKLCLVVACALSYYIIWWGIDRAFDMGHAVGQLESCRGVTRSELVRH